ncbi:MAG: response regulator transcription factor [Actinomycetota bacterium]|nr:response regulator transcription factor [Actinomycetota bacterium]
MYVALYPESPSASLTGALIGAGYQPVPIADVADAGRKEPSTGWAAAVVELGDNPDMAIAVARKLRDEYDVPVLIVVDRTLTGDLADKDGFDDFLLTPIDQVELRIRLSRIGGRELEATDDPVLRFGDLELNTATYQAYLAGNPVDLTYMEYELLRFFVEHPNRVWSREQILSKVWGYDYFGGSRTVDVHVRRLRAKLSEERASWITTVRSVGYRFG